MDIPTLSAEALSSLSKKIEANLNKPANSTIKPSTTGKSDAKRKAAKEKHNGTFNQNKEQPKGTKRLRNGQVKDADKRKNDEFGKRDKITKNSSKFDGITASGSYHLPKKANFQKSEKKGVPHGGDGKASSKDADGSRRMKNTGTAPRLQDEIKALGGTDEDLDLVEAIGSESEVEGSAAEDRAGNLIQDLKKLVNELGIEKVRAVEKEVSEEEEEGKYKTTGVEQEVSSSDIDVLTRKGSAETGKEALKGRKSSSISLVFEPRSEWHTARLPQLPSSSYSIPASSQDTIQIHQRAKELLEKENKDYMLHSGESSSAHRFYSTIMSSGTLSDKISALTLSVQESPLHNMKALDSLVGLAKKRSRDQAVEVLRALKDLLGPGNLLPSDRKLKAFAMQPGLSAALEALPLQNWKSEEYLLACLKPMNLVSWAYEDWLKKVYFDIVKVIETWCNDEIGFARGKMVDYVYELLRDKPEQEANLLRLLVNKLGDSDKKIASKTSHHILQLETSHPLMKPTILSVIESDLLFRPGQSMHAKYYAAITLNQTVLSDREGDVAKKLLDIYFTLFVNLLSKQEPFKLKLPDTKAVKFNKKGDRQGGGGAAGKKAQKKLAEQVKSSAVDDELREKMVSAVLTGVNRAFPYVKTDDEYFEKHLDTLFRITHSSNFNTSIQALLLIQQLCGTHQAASDRFYRTMYESLLDPRLLTSSKQAMYLNLLYKALRADLNMKRVKAFAKRLLQIVAMHQASFACGVIYLLRELGGVFANLQTSIDQPEGDESDEEEEFHDVREDGDEGQTGPQPAIQYSYKRSIQVYNGRKREPEYSHAEKSCLWEVTPFLLHFHPSVSLFASRLLTHNPMPPKPDFSMHTLIHFLDRFAYRNPKKFASGTKGSSIMQPLAGGDTSGVLVTARSAKYASRAPVNTVAFWKMEGEKVEADEVFFHKYFNTMSNGKDQARKKKADKKKGAKQGDSEEDDNEEEIWKALVDSRPEIEGSDQSDADLDMRDLESALGDSDDDDLSTMKARDINDQDIPDDDPNDEDDDNLSIDFGEDDDALLQSEDEIASDLDKAFKAEMQLGSSGQKGDASILDKEEERRNKEGRKRRRLKHLPTFASVDDYAAILGGDEDEDGR